MEGARTAAAARELWEERHWPLDEIDRLARAARAGPARADRRAACADRAALLGSLQARGARAVRSGGGGRARVQRRRRGSSTGSRSSTPRLDVRRLHDILAELQVRLGRAPAAGSRTRGPPERIRARRFDAVFVCGLEEGEFPRGARARAVPLRRGPARDRHRHRPRAAGARGRARPRALPVLRRRLARRAHAVPQLRASATRRATRSRPRSSSRTCATCSRTIEPRRRSLSDVVWSTEDAPTEVEFERALAASGPARDAAGAGRARGRTSCSSASREQHAFSASALETFADCPVRWLVDRQLQPLALEPDPEQMVRGRYAHEVLEATFSACARRRAVRASRATISRDAERLMRAALRERQSAVPALSVADARPCRRAAARVRPARLPAPRGRARRRCSSPSASSSSSASATTSLPPVRARGRGHLGARRDRPRRHLERLGAGARLQERQQRLQGGRLGATRTGSRPRST